MNPQPAGAAVPLGAQPPGANLVPHSPQSPANAVASTPALVSHGQTPNGVPDHALVAAPGYDSRLGGQVLGVPQRPLDDRVSAQSFGLPGPPPRPACRST